MRKLDHEGRQLSAIQGKIFEESVEKYSTSTPIFVRRFMKSELAKEIDSPGFMEKPFDTETAFSRLDKEYGKSNYGVERYHPDVMHWIGYIYRYWSYVYEISSYNLYKMIKPSELRDVYPGYHTMDPLAAIQRLMEDKELKPYGTYTLDEAVELMKQVREEYALKEYKAKSGKIGKERK